MNIESEPMLPLETPTPSFPWYTVWLKAFTSPILATYEQLVADPHGTAGTGFLWVIVAGLIGGVLIALSTVITGGIMGSFMDQGSASGSPVAGWLLGTVCFSLIFAPVSVALSAGVFQLVAKLLGGVGTYSKQIYMESALFAPAFLLGAVLGFIPVIGVCISGVFGLYAIYLRVLAINAVQKFGWGKSVATLLIPIAGLLLISVCTIALLALLGAGVAERFNQISNSLGP